MLFFVISLYIGVKLHSLMVGTIFGTGDMLLGGFWYKRLPSSSRRSPSCALLKDDPLAFTYSHLVLGSKFPICCPMPQG
jgi:hypothetical protein